MDNRLDNANEAMHRYQYPYMDMPQLRNFGLDNPNPWALSDYLIGNNFNATGYGPAYGDESDVSMPSSKSPQTELRITGPPFNHQSTIIRPAHEHNTRTPPLPNFCESTGNGSGDLASFCEHFQEHVTSFETIQDSANRQTSKNQEDQYDNHNASGEELETQHWHENSPLKCQWKDCESKSTFSNEGSLIRHIRATHISPKRYQCLHTGCKMAFGRKDRFRDHMRLKHPELRSKVCRKCQTLGTGGT